MAFWTITSRWRQPAGQGGRGEVDAVDAEAVEFLEGGELADDAFDDVREAAGLVVIVSDGEDVALS